LLKDFKFDDCVTQLTVYLPGNPSAELRAAAYDLGRRAEAAKVDFRCVVPRAVIRRVAVLPTVAWAEHLRGIAKMKPVMREELNLASIKEVPPVQAQAVEMLAEKVVRRARRPRSRQTAVVTRIRALESVHPAVLKVGNGDAIALAA
jgi:hypothetical protein